MSNNEYETEKYREVLAAANKYRKLLVSSERLIDKELYKKHLERVDETIKKLERALQGE